MFGGSDKYENGLYEIVNNSGDVYLYHCKYTLLLAMWHDGLECYGRDRHGVRVQNQLTRIWESQSLTGRATVRLAEIMYVLRRTGRLLLREDQCTGTKKVQVLGGTLETQDYSDLKDGAICIWVSAKGERVTLTNGDDTDDTEGIGGSLCNE